MLFGKELGKQKTRRPERRGITRGVSPKKIGERKKECPSSGASDKRLGERNGAVRAMGSSAAAGESPKMGAACGGCRDYLARQPRLWEREEVKRARRSQSCRCHGDLGCLPKG
jgi:hypothetical protein